MKFNFLNFGEVYRVALDYSEHMLRDGTWGRNSVLPISHGVNEVVVVAMVDVVD